MIYAIEWDNGESYEDQYNTLEWVGATSALKAYGTAHKILKEKNAGWTIITSWDKGEQRDMKFMLISGAVVDCIQCKDTGVIESRYAGQRRCWCEKGKQIDGEV